MGSSMMGEPATSESGVPLWWQDMSQAALGTAADQSKIGYVPYQGADVAAFTPQQVQGMQSANDWNAAFNTPGQAAPSVAASLPPAQDFGGGLMGYSSYGGYQDQMAALQKTYPGLAKYIASFSINPQTGAMPKRIDPATGKSVPTYSQYTTPTTVEWTPQRPMHTGPV